MHSLILLGAIRERRQRYLGEQVQEVDGSEAGFLQKWLFLLTFRSLAKRARRGDGADGKPVRASVLITSFEIVVEKV